jgi:uncharacterized membrane protein YhaH (DUF805 family)
MSPIDWAKRPIQKYADFKGRAPRAEYWWFVLGIVVAFIVLAIVEGVLGMNRMVAGVYGPLVVLLWLGTLVPQVAVGVRRLHDTDRTGWWLLAPIVPYAIGFAMMGPAALNPESGMSMASAGGAMIFMLIGMVLGIVLLVFYILPGTKGPNKYGPDPYGADVEQVFA